nr:hypothetical protein [Tanacetum cinerariifolium]
LKEAAKFVGDFKSLAKEADSSLANHNILELEIERLLKAVGKCKDTSCVSDTQNQLFQKLEDVNVELEFQDSSKNTNFAKQPIAEIPPKIGETKALSNPVTSNSVSKPPVSKGPRESLATPKPRKPRFLLKWSPTGRLFDHDGKLVASSKFESQIDCSNGCSKHMTGNLKLLINFVWKFMGTVRFGNDHVAAILGFGDLQWENILITRVYFAEGLGHNLFSVGQFCDSDLEVAFRRNACFVRNLEGVDLLKGDHSTNLYTINLHEMASASLICRMARASSTKSWLWHQRLSRLNFDTINDLARNDLVAGLLKFNINGKRYILVIVDDYSRYTWVHFLRSKDEAPVVIITFLKRITVLLQSPVI